MEATRYAQIGAFNIQWKFLEKGVKPPDISTINRTIKRYKLTHSSERVKKLKNEYPIQGYANLQQMDFVGPRNIKNYGRIYWLNIIDLDTHLAVVYPIKGKYSDNILPCLINFWQRFGIPDFLQMDNELSFRGNNRYPHCYGKVVRLCLSQHIRPIFIPVKEPWRNGVIEKFNNTFDKIFFREIVFTDYQSVVTKAAEFVDYHNNNHRYKAIKHKTPMDMFKLLGRDKALLKNDYTLPKTFEIDEGEVTIVRFIRSDKKLNIFGEIFILPKEVVYTYVMAVICFKTHHLAVYLDDKLIASFEYIIGPTEV